MSWSSDTWPTVATLEFKVNSNDKVLEAAGALFERLDPTPTANALLQILRVTLPMPKTQHSLRNEMASLPEKTVEETLKLAGALRLVTLTEGTQDGSPLVFNPYIFESDAIDTMKTLDALGPSERQHAQDIVNHVYNSPGVPLPVGTDPRVLKVLVEVGVIDYSKITTRNSSKGSIFQLRRTSGVF